MFNFFDELKSSLNLTFDAVGSFNLVNISNKVVYIEGQKGILKISSEQIIVKVKSGQICITGQDLVIKRITNTTLTIIGKIKQMES